MHTFFRVFIIISLIFLVHAPLVLSQGLQHTPYSSAQAVRNLGMGQLGDQTTSVFPSSRRSMEGNPGSETAVISSGLLQGMFPRIPNLQFGGSYAFSPNMRAATASADYLIPYGLGNGSTIFGEAHMEYQSFSIDSPGSPNNSLEFCLGGGYRKVLGNHTLFGVHSFYDSTRLIGNYYSSGSIGFEMASVVAGHDAIDINFNWYGQAFDASFMNLGPDFNSARPTDGLGNSNYDFQLGYSHELFAGGPDLRLSLTGYKFDTQSDVYGYMAGIELKSRDGVFSVKYDSGYDSAYSSYQAVAAFVNVGFQLENLADGKSPFVMPEAVFNSPRNLSRNAGDKVRRNWRHNTQLAHATLMSLPSGPRCPPQTVTVVNGRNADVILYLVFNANATGGYDLRNDFPGWNSTSNPYMLTTTMKAADPPLVISFSNRNQMKTSFAISADALPQTSCNVTLAEFTICDDWGQWGGLQDTYDISLVNGFNYGMEAVPSTGTAIKVTGATGNSNTPGVYGLGCDECNKITDPPCPAIADPKEIHPLNNCHISQSTGANWTLYIPPRP